MKPKQRQLPHEFIICRNCGYSMPIEHQYCGLCGADRLNKPHDE